jgi:hypothetical protein
MQQVIILKQFNKILLPNPIHSSTSAEEGHSNPKNSGSGLVGLFQQANPALKAFASNHISKKIT